MDIFREINRSKLLWATNSEQLMLRCEDEDGSDFFTLLYMRADVDGYDRTTAVQFTRWYTSAGDDMEAFLTTMPGPMGLDLSLPEILGNLRWDFPGHDIPQNVIEMARALLTIYKPSRPVAEQLLLAGIGEIADKARENLHQFLLHETQSNV